MSEVCLSVVCSHREGGLTDISSLLLDCTFGCCLRWRPFSLGMLIKGMYVFSLSENSFSEICLYNFIVFFRVVVHVPASAHEVL